MITIINFLSSLGVPLAMVVANLIVCLTAYLSGILGGAYEEYR